MNYDGMKIKAVIMPNPVGDGMIRIDYGMSGYYEMDDNAPRVCIVEKDGKEEIFAGIDPVVEDAFAVGSMFGWDVNAADPGVLKDLVRK
jgi:hypothetical protein